MSLLINLVFLFVVSVLTVTPKMRYGGSKYWPREHLKLSDQDNPNVIPYSLYDIYYEPVDNDEIYNEPSYLVAIKNPKSSTKRLPRNNLHHNFKRPKQKLLKYLSHETYITEKVKECLDINIIIYLKKHKVLRIDKLTLNVDDLKKYEPIPIYELLYIMENQCRDIEYLLGSSVQDILNDLNRIDELEIMTEINVAKVDILNELEDQTDKDFNIFYSSAQDLDNDYNVFMTDAPNIATNIHESESRASNKDLQNKSSFTNYEQVTEHFESTSNEEENIYSEGENVQVKTVTQNNYLNNEIPFIDTTTDSAFILSKTTQSKEVTQTNLKINNFNESVELESESTDIVNKNKYDKAVTNDIQGFSTYKQSLNTDSTTATVIRDNTLYPQIITEENNNINDILTTNFVNKNKYDKAVTNDIQGFSTYKQILNTDSTTATVIRDITLYPQIITEENINDILTTDFVNKNKYDKAVTNDIQGFSTYKQSLNTDSTTATVIRDNTLYPQIITEENNNINDILTTDFVNKNKYDKAVTNDIQGFSTYKQMLNTDSTTATVIKDNTLYDEIATEENNSTNGILNTKQGKRASVSSSKTVYPEIYRKYISAANESNETEYTTSTTITDTSELVRGIDESKNVEITTITTLLTQNNANTELGKQEVFVDITSISNTEQTVTLKNTADTSITESEDIAQIHYGDNASQNIGDMTTEDIINSTSLYVDLTSTYNGLTTSSTILKYRAEENKEKLVEKNKTNTKSDIVRLNDIELVTAATFDDFTQSEVSKSITYDPSNNFSTLDELIDYLTSSEKSTTLEGENRQVEIDDKKLYNDIDTLTAKTMKDLSRYKSYVIDELETTTSSYLLTTIDKSHDDVETNHLNIENENIKIIGKDTVITGKLYFQHNNVQIPLYFRQALDGKVNLNINGTEMCDKLIQKMSESLLIKTLCEQ